MLVHLAQYLHPPIPRNNKSSHKETIYTYKRRCVEASHDVSDSTPVDPTVHNATSWRGCKSTSVLCTSVLTVRISSFSLECFHTCRNISLHWGNGSNSASVSIRSYHWWTFWSTVEGAGAVGVDDERGGLEAYRCFKTIAPFFGITKTNGS